MVSYASPRPGLMTTMTITTFPVSLCLHSAHSTVRYTSVDNVLDKYPTTAESAVRLITVSAWDIGVWPSRRLSQLILSRRTLPTKCASGRLLKTADTPYWCTAESSENADPV